MRYNDSTRQYPGRKRFYGQGRSVPLARWHIREEVEATLRADLRWYTDKQQPRCFW